MLLAAMLMATTGPILRFDLEPPKRATGRVVVAADKPYEAGGYGYEPDRRGKEFLFSAAVPEGNYKVTIRVSGRVTVKAEQRRLMLRDIATKPGQYVTASFVVNVHGPALAPPEKNAPGGNAVRLFDREIATQNWDDKLTLEFLGDPRVASIDIEPVDVPTAYLTGDSTVTDNRAEPGASWGQMFTAMFDGGIAVANHAESGETLKSFLTGLRFDKVLQGMKQGDFLFIQFGHNDQKKQWPQTYVDADLTYPAYLRAYIAEAKRRGATPVLVTSPERRNFENGRIRPSLLDYAEAMRKVAREDNIALVDLQPQTIALYEALGPDKAPSLFGADGKDATHHNNAGAWLLARAVASGVATQVPALAAHLKPGMRSFDAARPNLAETAIAPSLQRSNARPAGN
ncbi:rhamnogalacturonan acetylesterase [Sphingomonas sp. HF-S4]|uniref:Rhamnogalacturonan acetylesterase n=1 Tax=Sphingomonas agrestis TaxID=3080540 RepID=A0ABU3YD84_9SPHN|nr:rhamnogalacturonan acetylesterase [Sphingomonas sp. HF-S4]MDV3459365.1 rhamnogalacturonan acetylesterase [Sphingomonas sp. HF-S4]